MYVIGSHVLYNANTLISKVVIKDKAIMYNTVKKGKVVSDRDNILALDEEVRLLDDNGEYRLGDLDLLRLYDKRTMYVSEESRKRGIGYHLTDSPIDSYVVDMQYKVGKEGNSLDLLDGVEKIRADGLVSVEDSELGEVIKVLDRDRELFKTLGIIYNKLASGVIRGRI